MSARNEAWISHFELKRAPFRWDLVAVELRFVRATDHVVADLCLVGTVSETTGTDGLEMLAIAGRLQEATGRFIDRAAELEFFFTLHRFRLRPGSDATGRATG